MEDDLDPATADGTSQTPTRAVDVVAILDGGAQVLADARPLLATVYRTAALMEHPLETGSVVADHIVRQPIEIALPLMIMGPNRRAVYDELVNLYEAGTVLSVQTRLASFENMVLVEIPHEEAPEAMDAEPVGVRFRQAKFVEAVYGKLPPAKVASKPASSTNARGAQQTTAATPAQTAKASEQAKGSTLYRLTRKK